MCRGRLRCGQDKSQSKLKSWVDTKLIVEERLESWVDTKLIVEKLESSVDAFGQHAGAPSYSLTVPFIRDFIDSQQNKMAERFGTCEGNLLLVKLPTL